MVKTSEMIERVAERLSLCGLDKNAEYFARKAIEAMREPTEEMRSAALTDIDNDPAYGMHEVMGAWRAMIDAALGKAPALHDDG